MALKEINGTFNGLSGDLYHQIHNVTGLQFGDNPHAHIRKRVFSSEQFRKENPEKPLLVDMEDFPISKEAAEQIKTILYGGLKNKKILPKTINHPEELNDEGSVVKEAWTEEVFETPYTDFVDC